MFPIIKRIVFFGIILWLAPLLVSLVIFPLRGSDRVFFEGLMQIVLILFTVVCILLFEKKQKLVWHVGLWWFLMLVLLDQLVFTWGPQKMSFLLYWKSIGVDYLAVPLIIWLASYQKSQKSELPDVETSKKDDPL